MELSLVAEPSHPRLTRMPASCISFILRIGKPPSTAGAGQWETPVPVAARTLYSSFVTSQSWAYHTSSPINPISSHQSMVRLPQRAIMPSFSPSPRWVCILTPFSLAMTTVSAKVSLRQLMGWQGAMTICFMEKGPES